MALAAATVWEIRTAGADDQGGGFVTGAGGTDYSQTDTKRVATGTDDSTVDAVANGTTTITSATANFQASIVGNIITLAGGTGTLAKGWYQVTARTNATTITVDRTVAAGTGITMNVGGALASLGMLGGAVTVSGNYVWVKAGTYTITSASTNISAGCLSMTTQAIYIEGYNAARGDLGTKPLIQANGVITAFTLINQGSNGQQFIRNMKFDGNNRATSQGCNIRGHIYDCEFINFTNNALIGGSLVMPVAFNCSATGCSATPAFNAMCCVDCVAFDNTFTGFTAAGGDCFFIRCIADSNSGATSDGFTGTASTEKQQHYNCIAYNNGRHGFFFNGQRGTFAANCIAEANGGTGYIHNSNIQISLYNCAAFNNTTANFTLGTNIGNMNIASVTGTGSFFTNAAAQDFTLNNTASAGAAARAAGTPGTIINLGTPVGFLDIGVYQHQETASTTGGSFVF